MSATAICRAELRSGWRRFARSVGRRPLATAVMGALALLMVLVGVRIIAFVAMRPEQFPDEGYGTILLLLFVLLLLRSAGITQRHALRAREVDLHLTQPVATRSVMLGQFGAVALGATALVALGVALSLLVRWGAGIPLVIPAVFWTLLALFALLAPLCGFLFSVLGNLQPMSRKLRYLATLAPLLMLLMYLASYAHAAPALVQQVSAAALLLLLGYLWLADGLYLDAVAAQRLATGTTLKWRVMELRWLRRLVGQRVAAVARKEITSAIRERDFLTATLSTLSISAILLFWYYQTGIPGEEVGDLAPHHYYPGLLALALYMAALLQCTLVGAALLGIEGRRLWVLKGLPVDSRTVMQGKGLGLLLLALPGIVLVWLPLALAAHFPWQVTLFFGEIAIALTLANAGLGLWAGVAFVSFDEHDRGNPDVLTQFMLIGASAFMSALLALLPAAVMLMYDLPDGTRYGLGLVAGALFAACGYGIYRLGVRSAADAYRTIWIDSYGA
ncbi:MAG: hypothetical protein QF766_01575 [Candidatus Poseidoniia archaeon]|jgi:hypothetical protein|nr:hypothetical protein [Candidatus Poseidoniia archaeon]MDP7535456.1 hypothetical protein [Candidatus Poseidoniia archaeon]MDP7608037.1 hypothetical protein [Candidatus Poseidoniia archaeon]